MVSSAALSKSVKPWQEALVHNLRVLRPLVAKHLGQALLLELRLAREDERKRRGEPNPREGVREHAEPAAREQQATVHRMAGEAVEAIGLEHVRLRERAVRLRLACLRRGDAPRRQRGSERQGAADEVEGAEHHHERPDVDTDDTAGDGHVATGNAEEQDALQSDPHLATGAERAARDVVQTADTVAGPDGSGAIWLGAATAAVMGAGGAFGAAGAENGMTVDDGDGVRSLVATFAPRRPFGPFAAPSLALLSGSHEGGQIIVVVVRALDAGVARWSDDLASSPPRVE
eukprot:CAMPEP_0119417898 /NCGR_PEP_ID=MMETSP1335-20130426/16953_1 /TAXON_ID=259385 /ORGANISM="Chrysoculter rhomboideus, Strain RCC1486" /LENGTH=287 /DNA_ID=CAMNT_0007443113 /DNA_START=285 /DNA_END=1149 /DNA_ORIENTATION=+